MSGVKEHSGRVAIVTGASSGIGRACAIALAAEGARVVAVARNAERLAELARDVSGIVPLALSIDTPQACAKIVEAARAHGPPLILINNAGLGGHLDRPIFEHRSEDWRAMMAVNLDAPYELTRHVSHDIRKAGFGRVVTISSTAGEVGAPSMSAYCASKHGVIGLMRAVAHDIAPFGGTANAVLPSWVRTEMAERDAEREAGERGIAVEAVWRERERLNPAGRIVTAEEVANMVAYLASAMASGLNGQAITVSIGAVW
jgi:NAD(P)-dependent dehydrogenase (short-subunit alcohol dehydrogenase family)